jgi:hypothetical protein
MVKGSSGMSSGAEQEIERFLTIAGDEDAVGQIFRTQRVQSEIYVVLTIVDQ